MLTFFVEKSVTLQCNASNPIVKAGTMSLNKEIQIKKQYPGKWQKESIYHSHYCLRLLKHMG